MTLKAHYNSLSKKAMITKFRKQEDLKAQLKPIWKMLIMASMQNHVALVKHCNSFSATTIWRKIWEFFCEKTIRGFCQFLGNVAKIFLVKQIYSVKALWTSNLRKFISQKCLIFIFYFLQVTDLFTFSLIELKC